jgi:hypothetical protein
MHHIAIIVITDMLTLYYSIMLNATRIYVTTVDLLTITCTLVATCMILGRLECHKPLVLLAQH